jgi:hypothetical protein
MKFRFLKSDGTGKHRTYNQQVNDNPQLFVPCGQRFSKDILAALPIELQSRSAVVLTQQSIVKIGSKRCDFNSAEWELHPHLRQGKR